jgi:hypothetical protein
MERYPAYIYTPSGKLEKKNSSSEKKPTHKKKVEEERVDEGRRTLLKGIGAVGVMAAFGMGLKMAGDAEEKNQPASVPEAPTKAVIPEVRPEQAAAAAWHESVAMREPLLEDAIAFREIVKWDHGKKVDLNADTPNRVEANWTKRYMYDPRLRDSLISGYKEMGAWLPYIEQIFEDEGVPKKYAYLAIAESHFDIRKPSPAGAVGHFQFMERTARGKVARLKIGGGLDERKDPLKAAEACARVLMHDYKLIGDWDLTISCYNGHFAWDYIALAKKNGIKPTYPGFLEFIEQDINKTIDKLNHGLEYTARKNDSLRRIAMKMNYQGVKVTVDEIAEHNGLAHHAIIKEGQKLRIPLSEREKEYRFNKKVKGYIENLNYPPKFKAIYHLIETGFVKDKKNEVKFRPYLVRQEKEETRPKKKWLKRIFKPKKTLRTVAHEVGQPEELLAYLNQGLDRKAPIPDGYVIRIASV